jgi:hypothetical protein
MAIIHPLIRHNPLDCIMQHTVCKLLGQLGTVQDANEIWLGFEASAKLSSC